jgi:hypothetical protein
VTGLDFSKAIVLGTGYSVDTFFNKLKHPEIIKSNTTIAFQAAFYFAYEKYNFIPDVWSWSDPHSALEGLKFLLEKKQLFTSREKELRIIIPNFVDTSCRDRHTDFCGTSPVWRDPELEKFYYDSLEEVKKIKNVSVQVLNVYTTKLIAKKPLETRDCQNIFTNPVERFVIDRPIIGSFRYSTDNSYVDVWGRENKISFFIFPVLVYLGCKSLGVAGFDFGGNRFFNNNSKHPYYSIDKEEVKRSPEHQIVKIWSKEWYKYHNMKIYSLVDSGESGLNDILES